jgi:hypothetical protein
LTPITARDRILVYAGKTELKKKKLRMKRLENYEIELIGDVQHFEPIIIQVANELDIPDYAINAKRIENTNTYSRFKILSTERSNPSFIPIGILTLTTIGNNRTILRIPPRSQWGREIHGEELVRMGYIEGNITEKNFYDSQFAEYLSALNNKLQTYKLKMTWYRRIWRSLMEILGIYKAIKL